MKRLLVAAAFAACTISVFALPSVEAVKAEVAKGHDVQAEQMIREVLAARPDSARAHYVHAEILAHEGRFKQAAEEAAQARRLDPALSFTQPETFRAFEALLAREQAAAGARAMPAMPHQPATAPASGVPTWVWAGGLGLMALLAMRRFAAPSTSVPVPAPAGMGATALPYGSGPSMPAAGGLGAGGGGGGAAGSGLLGTGLAVAGGVAAGMLAERLFEGHHEVVPDAFRTAAPASAPLESFDDTTTEALAARELEERPIDMGNGDGWGGAETDTDSGTGSAASGSSDGW